MERGLRRNLYLCALFALGASPSVLAVVTDEDIKTLEEEIKSLEVAKDTSPSVSGYVDAEYINDTRSTSALNASGTPYGFRVRHLSLFVTKKFNDNWKFFSEIEFKDGTLLTADPNAKGRSGSMYVEAANVDYQWRSSQYLRIGRDFTPTGMWSIDHYTPYVPTQIAPMHVRAIFPDVVDGADAHGTVPMGATFMNYDVYLANGVGTTGQTDDNRQKALGARVSFILPMLKYLELGASALRDTDPNNYTQDPTVNLDSRKTAYGIHGKLKIEELTLQTEYASDTKKPLDGSADTREVGYYLQGFYDIGKWTGGYRYDFWNPDRSAGVKVTDNVFFINYHVSPTIVCKLEHHIVNYQDPAVTDYGRTILSLAYYLGM